MENADLVLVLIVTAIGAFAGGILFGMWLIKRVQPVSGYRLHGKNLPMGESRTADIGRGAAQNLPNQVDPNSLPVGGKYQSVPSRVGWPAIKRQLEEDDPEARRHEEIMQANGGN